MTPSGRRLTMRMRSCSCGASAMSVDGRAAWPIGANSKSCYREQKSAGRVRPASRRHGPARPAGFLTNSLISIGYGTRRTCGRASRPASFARAQTKVDRVTRDIYSYREQNRAGKADFGGPNIGATDWISCLFAAPHADFCPRRPPDAPGTRPMRSGTLIPPPCTPGCGPPGARRALARPGHRRRHRTTRWAAEPRREKRGRCGEVPDCVQEIRCGRFVPLATGRVADSSHLDAHASCHGQRR